MIDAWTCSFDWPMHLKLTIMGRGKGQDRDNDTRTHPFPKVYSQQRITLNYNLHKDPILC